nr:MAG TPA: hypothetical protein [Caudoviricetes sp.]
MREFHANGRIQEFCLFQPKTETVFHLTFFCNGSARFGRFSEQIRHYSVQTG